MRAFEGGVIDHGGAHQQVGGCSAGARHGECACVGSPRSTAIAGVLKCGAKVDRAVGAAAAAGVVGSGRIGERQGECLACIRRD